MESNLQLRYQDESVAGLPGDLVSIESEWKSPSNIALIKYWGKFAGQLPRNPSLSFSLKEAISSTKVVLKPSPDGIFELTYQLDNQENRSFESRIKEYIESLFPYFPFLQESSLSINSHNTFPHSSGIASSASGMSSIALCLCALEEKISGIERGIDFFGKASYIARLGSGSASRSVYGNFVSWGFAQGFKLSSDEFASPLDFTISPSFKSLCDAILIISPEKKKVSSSQGHSLMKNHPYASLRYEQAKKNFTLLMKAIKSDDVETFIRITENEALSLHGLMMSSDPGFLLLEPASLEIIDRIRKFREETGTFITFTIDAGPNVHLIYSLDSRDKVLDFIKTELQPFCFEGNWIDDRMGEGPEEINS